MHYLKYPRLPINLVLLIACLCQFFAAPSAWATNYEYDFSKSQVVLSEEQQNNKIFQVSKLLIASSPQKVFNILTDYEHATTVFSRLRQCEVLSSNGQKKDIFFTVAAAGGLFTFDYVLEVTEQPPTRQKPAMIQWRRLRGALKDNEGYWKLEPMENGKSTMVTYSKYVDGGFLFPQFLVKKELRYDMPISLAELKDTVESSNQVADVSSGSRQVSE